MIRYIPFSDNPLTAAAQQIIAHHQAQLPDLGNCRILVADTQCAPALRAALLDEAAKHGHDALLGPSIQRIDTWLQDYSDPHRPALSMPAQELILAEALGKARQLYSGTDPWLLAEHLLQLFGELTANQLPPDDSADDFQARLQQAYGLSSPSPGLQQEAYTLHTLWHAWRQQLLEENATDPASAHLARLQACLADPPEEQHWLLGFTEFTPAEFTWLRAMLADGRTHLLLHGTARESGNHPDAPLQRIREMLDGSAPVENVPPDNTDAYSRFIDALCANDAGHLKQRATTFKVDCPVDPVAPRLRTLCVDSPEMEAQAVALQTRLWLLEGQQPVAIVTEDRRLARRVRAMLEASGIQLDDPAGWALSTTSAAAVIERWLETVEEDFACGPMLDVLKSPFFGSSEERELHLTRVRRLEQDIVLHEQVARGLDRYRRHVDLRSQRLPGDWGAHTRSDLHRLLNQLDHAAEELRPLLDGTYSAQRYMQCLCASLQMLGIWQQLEQDAAGQAVIRTLEQLSAAADTIETELDWQAMRAWLARNLERATFQVSGGSRSVKLLTLEQTRLQRFARVLIAGCSQANLPGKQHGQTFFNQGVRSQLGLATWSQQLVMRLHHFVRVLHSADRLLLTHHAEAEGEPVPVSPWLALLETFHFNTYGGSLADTRLKSLLHQEGSRPDSPDQTTLPVPAARPRPVLPPGRAPHTWSASSHQRLIDCPYLYYAADALGLKAQEVISEALSKADYGALIHRVLEAFHSDISWLPGPWTGPLGEPQREQAIQLLGDISRAVFNKHIEDNFEARGWLREWQDCIPPYIDWQINRQQHWVVQAVEVRSIKQRGDWFIKGRIDRIDHSDNRLSVLDYKTGTPPRTADVLAGEAVQLSSYALMLDDSVTELDYLKIGKGEVRTAAVLAEHDVPDLVEAVGTRLTQLNQALSAEAPLPAWGDEATCHWCDFRGVCRRDMWQHEAEPDD